MQTECGLLRFFVARCEWRVGVAIAARSNVIIVVISIIYNTKSIRNQLLWVRMDAYVSAELEVARDLAAAAAIDELPLDSFTLALPPLLVNVCAGVDAPLALRSIRSISAREMFVPKQIIFFFYQLTLVVYQAPLD
jgi:hypothetical protein